MKYFSAGLMALAASVGCAVAELPSEGTHNGPAVQAPNALERLVLSVDLVNYGQAHCDAASFILAARLRLSVHLSPADLGGTVSLPAVREGRAGPDWPSAAQYLDLAETCAAGNRWQLQEIAAIRALQDKDVIAHDFDDGALQHSRWLAAGAVWKFEVLVEQGRPVMIVSISDGDSAVRLNVVNEAGELVASSPANDYRAVVEWLPQYEQRFTIEVTNMGSVESYVAVFSD